MFGWDILLLGMLRFVTHVGFSLVLKKVMIALSPSDIGTGKMLREVMVGW